MRKSKGDFRPTKSDHDETMDAIALIIVIIIACAIAILYK